MKNIVTILGISMLLLFTSCGNDDDATTTNDEQLETPVLPSNYFPAEVNNYWNYDVAITNNANLTTEQDSLYVVSRNGDSFMLDVNMNNVANGTMNTLLANGTLTEQGTALTLSSSIELPIDLIGNGIDFEGAVLYDTSVPNNTTLFTLSDTFTQDVQGFPMTIAYTLSTKKIERLNSFTVNSETFNDVEVVDFTLELSMTTSVDVLGNATTVPIIDPQNVLITRSYYGPNVGLLKADSTIGFSLNPTTVALLQTLNINLNIPTSSSTTNVEELTSYSVGN